MNLHEYQEKQLFNEFGLPVPRGEVAYNVNDAMSIVEKLGGERFVVKAQVHAGGRGKAGGVRIVSGKTEVTEAVQDMLGKRLVTYQTDEKGQPVNSVLIEHPSDIARELYLGAVIDRSTRRVVFMASTEGGVEIEKVAELTPEKILKLSVDPLLGAQAYQAREIAFQLDLNPKQVMQYSK